ncbi:hypothetical protein N658DRAFT_477878 [Parathielavia hyrcaniae]|uniref:Uncharacterized protein n=1 Tax=Parathielavia hyrcaniae TaxID=113614 RepID=A0AAN6PUG4_9PEZI|nr:hypothetical protein N658DRAFT_477878 [Parathielavia hyrcaniae]
MANFPQSYQDILEESREVPVWFNIAAAFSSWILLAGFVLLPGTFASLDTLEPNDELGRRLQSLGQNIPLLCFAAVCCFFGVIGITFLWVRFRYNYIWLLDNLLGPSLANSVSGLMTSLVGVYASHRGEWSITAIVTISVVASTFSCMSTAFLTYRLLLKRGTALLTQG